MRGGEVGDVDVVADAGAVRGRVVVTEQLQLLPLPGGDRKRDRDQVALRVVPLADQRAVAAAVRAGHVEVPQRHRGQPVRPGLVTQRVVDRELRGGVRVRWPGLRGLLDGQLVGIAVDVGGGGEHQPPYPGRAHRVEQPQRADEVVLPVPFRLLHRLAGEDQAGEVQYPVEARVEHLRR